MIKPKLHNFYMDIVNKFASQSKDPKFKVGALIVTHQGILYPGYNGDEIGGDNTRDSMNTGMSGFVHGEANALIKYNPTIHTNSVMYVTFNPCTVCARMIVNAQTISEVYYDEEYSADMKGVDILRKRGIKCEKLTPKCDETYAKQYSYRVIWSPEDKEYVGLCDEFPSLSCLGKNSLVAFEEITQLVGDIVEEMQTNGDPLPPPRSAK